MSSRQSAAQVQLGRPEVLALENFYLGQAATGRSETPEELAQAVSDMTAERICRAMETVRLDTVYFLKGKEAEA